MTRHLLTVAMCALWSAQLPAQEPPIWFEDYEASAQLPAPVLDDPADAVEESWGSIVLSLNLEDVLSEEVSPPGNSAADYVGRGFHPVCNCGCRIPPLDRWCDCYPPCCTTSCWVDYPCQCSQGNCYRTESGKWVSNDACCDVSGVSVYRSDSAVRFGWWGTSWDGSPVKIGEYQSLGASPFYDVEAISSNGQQTLDFTLTGLDSETNYASLNFYGPAVSAKVNYQRYPRRLDHDPLTGYDLDSGVPPGPNDNVVSEDLNVGEDYAIRVQELDAKFKGRWSDNLKWRLNLWGQRKFGERQTNAVAHCFFVGGAAGNTCHVLSQSQTIDWLTMEIQPVVEAEFENVTVEYSRTMRSFGQDDGIVSRQYTNFNGFQDGSPYNYALVPDNFTQIDRLKIGASLTENNQFYGNLFVGDTKNEFRDTHRNYNGFDLRLMNNTYDDLNITAYASRYQETNELPTTFLTAPPLAPANTYDEDSLRHPVDYFRTRAGVKGTWKPFGKSPRYYPSYGFLDGSSFAAGYEYHQLERDFATYNTTPVPPGPFTQPDTITHKIELGPSTRWSRSLQTYTRYKGQFIHVPLIGVSEYSDDDPDIQGTFNSNLPEQVHSVEIGSTWTPTDNFMTTAQFTIENSWHRSQFANFTENNYPIVCTVWYAPTNRWSLTSGYAYFNNWIDQNITLGANRGDPAETETTRWNYAGRNHLASFNANYAWSECVQLVGGYEWNRGSNAFIVPTSPHAADGVDWSLLPSLSDVEAETQRLTAGVDWQPGRRINVYLRYIYFDYNDIAAGLDSGTSHMALAGAGANW